MTEEQLLRLLGFGNTTIRTVMSHRSEDGSAEKAALACRIKVEVFHRKVFNQHPSTSIIYQWAVEQGLWPETARAVVVARKKNMNR